MAVTYYGTDTRIYTSRNGELLEEFAPLVDAKTDKSHTVIITCGGVDWEEIPRREILTPCEHNGGSPIRRGERQGRNEPCSCGSGKKFKVCCGR